MFGLQPQSSEDGVPRRTFSNSKCKHKLHVCLFYSYLRCGTKFVLFCCLQLEVWSDNPGEARIYETILDGGRHASAPYYILQWSRRLRSLVLDHMFRSTAGLTTSKAEKCECVSDFPHWSADLTRTMEVSNQHYQREQESENKQNSTPFPTEVPHYRRPTKKELNSVITRKRRRARIAAKPFEALALLAARNKTVIQYVSYALPSNLYQC